MREQYKHLDYEKRCEIKRLLDDGFNNSEIADKIGVSRATIGREIKKGINEDGVYDPMIAESKYRDNLKNKGTKSIVLEVPGMAEYIAECILEKNVSVKKVPELLGKDNRFSKYAVSYQTVYNAIDNGLIPGVTRESLRTSSVTMYSDGQIGIPKWIREKYGFADGDVFGIEVLENQSILLVRQ